MVLYPALQALAFSERTHLGPDMYVIVRVSRIGMPEPSYMVYPDPHRGLFMGHLQYACDIYLQRNMELERRVGVNVSCKNSVIRMS